MSLFESKSFVFLYRVYVSRDELLLVSRIFHSLLDRGNHVKVEALIMPPPHPLTSLSIPPYPN